MYDWKVLVQAGKKQPSHLIYICAPHICFVVTITNRYSELNRAISTTKITLTQTAYIFILNRLSKLVFLTLRSHEKGNDLQRSFSELFVRA